MGGPKDEKHWSTDSWFFDIGELANMEKQNIVFLHCEVLWRPVTTTDGEALLFATNRPQIVPIFFVGWTKFKPHTH